MSGATTQPETSSSFGVSLRRGASPKGAGRLTALVAVFYLILVAQSPQRRVGDGHEYVAMARQLASARAPSATPRDLVRLTQDLDALGDFGTVRLVDPPLVGRRGRQDFRHFWLYSLLAAPFVALLSPTRIPWTYAFAIVNVGLLTAMAYALFRRVAVSVASMLLLGPILWWIDKAQIEVFNYALLGLAFAVWSSAPRLSLVLLGALTTQNPAFALVLVPAAVWRLWQADAVSKRRIAAAAGLAFALVALHPMYYLWRLGRLSALQEAAVPYWPSLTALLTPLLDPWIGLCWYFPGVLVLLMLAISGIVTRRMNAEMLIALAAAAGLLVVFALSGNVNHGGTPGPSRYGVWLMPFVIPFLMGGGTLGGWRGGALAVVAVASMVQATSTFHPGQPEHSLDTPPLAVWLTDRWPSAYNPLPEVFAERMTGVDGRVSLPVASPGCSKVLLAGEGRVDTAWPVPCRPASVPASCAAAGALCYANRIGSGAYEFVAPPRQPSFGYGIDAEPVWRSADDVGWLPARLAWDRLARVQPMTGDSLIRGAVNVRMAEAFQGDGQLLVFVEPDSSAPPRLLIRPRSAANGLWWLDRQHRVVIGRGRLEGEAWIEAPTNTSLVLMVMPTK